MKESAVDCQPACPRHISFPRRDDEYMAIEDLTDYNYYSILSCEPIPAVVTFANQCLVRSYERRSRSSFIMLPPSLLLKSRMASYSTILPIESSYIRTPLDEYNMSSSIIFSSATSYESPQLISDTSRSVEELLYDTRQLPSREQEIKRELNIIKIKYYHQRCELSMRSLNNAIMHYNKNYAISGCNHDSDNSLINDELSALSALGDSENDRAGSTAEVVQDIPRRNISINSVISEISILFELYKDVLSNNIALP